MSLASEVSDKASEKASVLCCSFNDFEIDLSSAEDMPKCCR